jgi:hypothetical protein
MNLTASRAMNMKKINDRFEAARGKATVKWRTDELMQILRGDELCAALAERGIEASDVDDAVAWARAHTRDTKPEPDKP